MITINKCVFFSLLLGISNIMASSTDLQVHSLCDNRNLSRTFLGIISSITLDQFKSEILFYTITCKKEFGKKDQTFSVKSEIMIPIKDLAAKNIYIELQKGRIRGESYVDLPTHIMQLPQKGIRFEDKTTYFDPIANRDSERYFGGTLDEHCVTTTKNIGRGSKVTFIGFDSTNAIYKVDYSSHETSSKDTSITIGWEKFPHFRVCTRCNMDIVFKKSENSEELLSITLPKNIPLTCKTPAKTLLIFVALLKYRSGNGPLPIKMIRIIMSLVHRSPFITT